MDYRGQGLAGPWVALILLGCVVALAGCGSVKKDKMAMGLHAATSGYQSALRWGYYETAYGFVHPDLRKDKPIPPIFEKLRLTGYDVVQPPTMKDEDTATQIVAIDYLFEDRQVVKHLTDRQEWRWDEKLESWWLQTGLPNFKP